MPTKARTRQPATEARRTRERETPRTAKVDLPFVTAEFRVPQLPNREDMAETARSLMPSAREAAYYGGLMLLAAFEMIEWPVAAAIGVGAAVLGRGHDRGEREEHEAAAHARVPTPRQ
ncbi:hypothetical protein [Amycolatopsis taiwanensis]|uniref:hypothetical protein n=1 Tax=Amycolatopsis taiwanensis TaxID=342230 RepID=UPI0004B6800D|nr:hypothetical protein [Amycolatopsis taiwanensis]